MFCQSRLDSDDCWTLNQSKNTEASIDAPDVSEEDPRVNRETPRWVGNLLRIGWKIGSHDPKQSNNKTTHTKTKSQNKRPPIASLETPEIQETRTGWVQTANTFPSVYQKSGKQNRKTNHINNKTQNSSIGEAGSAAKQHKKLAQNKPQTQIR